jgi:gluconate 5-dehydrogenase
MDPHSTPDAPIDAKALFDLTGRRALVTGAGRGIGTVLAEALASAGAEVILNDRDAPLVGDTRERMAERTGATVHTAVFDVTDADAVSAGVGRLLDDGGPIDILVNNTGIQHREPMLEVSAQTFRRVLDVNLAGAFLVARAVVPGMIRQRYGKIVNICSVQSTLARPGIAAYAASKGGMSMLTKSMCAEWAAHGITANGLAPGYVVTDLTRPLVENPEFNAWITGRTPAARWANVSDLVGTLLWLAAPASDFVNGQIVTVDGGLTAVV